jgi:hypothetical protein
MGNTQSIKKINFEDIQIVLKNPESYLLINTLAEVDQNCLIKNTIPIHAEENIINKHMRSGKHIHIVIYGRNSNDERLYKKYQQLLSLGFYNVCVYLGGLFEWLLLQDIYGADEFPTTSKQLDMLKYKANSVLNVSLLEYT